MSAIWGCVGCGSDEIMALRERMKARMNRYKIERIDDFTEESVYFACGHQYFTPEAKDEVLPIYDKDKDVFFTGDCMLDNRQELMSVLNIEDTSMPDGMLAWMAYGKWGEQFVSHLLGAFAFAIYNRREDIFCLYADHVSNRCINYRLGEKRIYFSTTYDLFREAFTDGSLSLSEKWITACEGHPSVCMIMFPGLTPYDKVYQVKAGCYIRICRGRLQEIEYWNPLKNRSKLKLTQEEYKKHFLDTYRSCIEGICRPGNKVASQLSGGLDSTSIVSIAAPLLKCRGEKLITFTSIPDGGKVEGYSDLEITDESDNVKKTAEFYGNLECHFIDCPGVSAFTNLSRFVQDHGFPMKSAINHMWIDEVEKRCVSAGCKIILSGQYGNTTISSGDILSTVYQQLCNFRIGDARKTARVFMMKNHVRKQFFIEYFRKGGKQKLLDRLPFHKEDIFEESPVKKELLRKYNLVREYYRRAVFYGNGLMNSPKQRERLLFQIDEFQQLGMYNTLGSLINGCITRDPTRDKRILELCMAYPENSFVADGIERYMVRGYMKELLPPHIRQNVLTRGVQGADFLRRINRNWEKEKNEVLEWLNRPELENYLDKKSLEAMRKRLMQTDTYYLDDNVFLRNVLYSMSLSIFLNMK